MTLKYRATAIEKKYMLPAKHFAVTPMLRICQNSRSPGKTVPHSRNYGETG